MASAHPEVNVLFELIIQQIQEIGKLSQSIVDRHLPTANHQSNVADDSAVRAVIKMAPILGFELLNLDQVQLTTTTTDSLASSTSPTQAEIRAPREEDKDVETPTGKKVKLPRKPRVKNGTPVKVKESKFEDSLTRIGSMLLSGDEKGLTALEIARALNTGEGGSQLSGYALGQRLRHDNRFTKNSKGRWCLTSRMASISTSSSIPLSAPIVSFQPNMSSTSSPPFNDLAFSLESIPFDSASLNDDVFSEFKSYNATPAVSRSVSTSTASQSFSFATVALSARLDDLMTPLSRNLE